MVTLYKEFGDEKYKLGIETLVEQMKGQPRTNADGFWHKKIYPYQMWLDGLYMACPFLTRYAVEFNQPQWLDCGGSGYNAVDLLDSIASRKIPNVS